MWSCHGGARFPWGWGQPGPPPKAFSPSQVSQATGMCGGGLQPTSCQQLEEELWDLSRLGEGVSDSWGRQNPPGRSQSGLCCFPACHSQECHSPSPLPKKNNSRSHVYSFCSWTEAVSLRLPRILAPGLAIGPHAGMHGDGTQTSALLPWTRGCCSQMWCPRGAGPAASTLLGS